MARAQWAVAAAAVQTAGSRPNLCNSSGIVTPINAASSRLSTIASIITPELARAAGLPEDAEGQAAEQGAFMLVGQVAALVGGGGADDAQPELIRLRR